MSKRKPMDKDQARERRNRLLESAAAAGLSLTAGVREMRAIAGMTQEEFARHRGVSARVIKAIELGQGNPTVATMNRIGQFFGLEVAFVPIRREALPEAQPQPADNRASVQRDGADVPESVRQAIDAGEALAIRMRELDAIVAELGVALGIVKERQKTLEDMAGSLPPPSRATPPAPDDAAPGEAHVRAKRKRRPS